MSYSDFSLADIRERLGLSLVEKKRLFGAVEAVAYSEHLRETLRDHLPLATAIHTEKARSELIVAPLLVEVLKQCDWELSLFSGVDFPVDKGLGLSGVCDFLIGLSPEQFVVDAPLVAIVEAKNDSIKSGLGQCAAEMRAAQMFNEAKGLPLPSLYGAVTTGTLWTFLRLVGNQVWIDADEYHISNVAKIIGIFMHIVETSRAALEAGKAL
jgi:hypothetical protein